MPGKSGTPGEREALMSRAEHEAEMEELDKLADENTQFWRGKYREAQAQVEQLTKERDEYVDALEAAEEETDLAQAQVEKLREASRRVLEAERTKDYAHLAGACLLLQDVLSEQTKGAE